MTEDEWLACADPERLMASAAGLASRRKHRLLGCGWCRRIWHALSDSRSREAVEQSELYADGQITQEALSAAQVGADRATQQWDRRNFTYARTTERVSATRLLAAARAAKAVARPSNYLNTLSKSIREALPNAILAEFGYRLTPVPERSVYCDLTRCVFGNPFRATVFSESWLTDTVCALARQMYESRDFSAMPILADALQDAGCDNDGVLSHCRGSGPHVRGCWVCDLMLGKE